MGIVSQGSLEPASWWSSITIPQLELPLAAVLMAAIVFLTLLFREILARYRRSRAIPITDSQDHLLKYRLDGDRPHDGRKTPPSDEVAWEPADSLGYGELVSAIGDLILNARHTSLALAIEAKWGMGKTSVMLMLRNWLDTRGCLTVWFDAWKYQDSEMQSAFMDAVVSGIPIPLLANYLNTRRGRLAGIRASGDFVGKATRMGAIGTAVANALQSDARYRDQVQEEFGEIIKYWANPRRGSRMHTKGPVPLVVIFVDDLDRCEPKQIARALETMKLFFDTPGCIFVFGFDPNIVADSIRAANKDILNDGLEYLKKVIQLEYKLPPPTEENLRAFIDDCIETHHLRPYFDGLDRNTDYHKLIIDGTGRNLRDIKRFLDALVVGARIMNRQLEAPIRRHQTHFALIILILLQIRWPRFYQELSTAAQQQELESFVTDVDQYLKRAERGARQLQGAAVAYEVGDE